MKDKICKSQPMDVQYRVTPRKGRIRNISGHTLMELIIIIAIAGILSALGVLRLIGFTDIARMNADRATLRELNTATRLYEIGEGIGRSDVFEGISSDLERMARLVDKNYISNIVSPQHRDGEFAWNIGRQEWLYLVHDAAENLITRYVFRDLNIGDFLFSGDSARWGINEDGLKIQGSYGNDLIYVENRNREYTLKTRFQMNQPSRDRGGLGILFESSIDKSNDNRDSGYILQFDRGYADGEIILRKRSNGIETSPLLRISDGIPSKSDAEWWSSEKEIELSVREGSDAGKKLLTVELDGKTLIKDFEIESDIDPNENYTGFRGWAATEVTVYDLEID